MAGFKAKDAVSKLGYDFTGLEIANEEDQKLLDSSEGKGTTPEPSGEQVRHFQSQQRKLLDLSPDTPIAEVNRRMLNMTEDQLLDLDDQIMDMVAEVVSNRPSRDVIAALPFRVREAYYGYVLGSLANFPGGSVTTPS